MFITPQEAAEQLKAGKVVALPTETVYGLAASLTKPLAIAEVFRLKGRPQDNPLIVHLSSAKELDKYLAGGTPPSLLELTKRFWPGPLTLVLPIREETIPESARANQPTCAFRVPDHPQIREVLSLAGALVAPSANLSGKPSPTSAQHVMRDFGQQVPVVDGGCCSQGVESTILAYKDDQWFIARLGMLPPESFLTTLGYQPRSLSPDALLCPGSRYKHYAPGAKLILGRTGYAQEAEVVIGFADRCYPRAKLVLSLGNSSAPLSALQNLYHVLRQLDEKKISIAWVDFEMPPAGHWLTVRERLLRAAQQ